MNLAAKRAEVEEEDVEEGGVEEEYVAEEEVERFQDLENVKVVSENDKGITRRNAISGSFGMSFDFPSLFDIYSFSTPPNHLCSQPRFAFSPFPPPFDYLSECSPTY